MVSLQNALCIPLNETFYSKKKKKHRPKAPVLFEVAHPAHDH